MIKFYTFLTGFLLLAVSFASAQRKVSELTLVYDVAISNENKEPGMADALDGAITTVYIKGDMSRSEMVSALFSSATIHDSKAGTAVVLKEVSGQKLLIRMNSQNWIEKNKHYNGIVFINSGETKVINGYSCSKAEAKLNDGGTFIVYYTTDIVPENKEYDYTFRNLNGLPLQYELIGQGKPKIKYTVSKISFDPVPAAKFDIPKSGYREMTYEESRNLPH
jgi:GLPGLI family protein